MNPMHANSGNGDGPSRLFHVPPQGVGGFQVESLSGYVARLAAEHLITPSTLLHRELAWRDLGKPEMCGRWLRKPRHLKLTASMNFHESGLRWITHLEKLTGVHGLAACMALSWTRHFPSRGLARTHLAWCPLCLAGDDTPYHRLLWCFSDAKACPEHGSRLVERCPSCSSTIPVMHARTRPGHCSHCNNALFPLTQKPPPASEDEVYKTRLIAEMIGVCGRNELIHSIQMRALSDTLRRCQKSAGIKDASHFAALLHVSRITAWYWLTGKSEPTLGHVLRACLVFDLTLWQFLHGEIPALNTPRQIDELPLRFVRRTPKRFREEVSIRKIEEFLHRHAQTPPSLNEVARYVDVEPRVLRRHAATFCRQISARHREAIKRAASVRSLSVANAIEKVVREKLVRGEILCAKAISRELPKPGVLRAQKARAVVNLLLSRSKKQKLPK